ncbi:hypothetical protein BV25DRAFT_1892081 [Artomyces pyxidatus]|uniref:Uncharacterized protein n=1 Tax=Artomyces pyxidatus TaxID=48021 RepID=A0ACB8SNM4_9AGAM|nr:hypothetical protein BV25DRAFT_1892081 [Artomyces pyxidatus]
MSDGKKSEDALPESPTYAYQWSPESELPLEDFLTKACADRRLCYKPSMVQDDGTKPWIWVRGSQSPAKSVAEEGTAVDEAQKLLKEVTEKVDSIKNDSSIPIRSNKKTGAKSKKEVREVEQALATEKLKDISTRTGFVSGKWLIFAPSEKVDKIWSTVATSLVSGPLSSTAAHLAKVATCPKNETPNYQHVLCIYLPDVYDKDAVTQVLKILLRNHGLNTLGVKSNLYTAIGLDSKHASGIPSTVWKNSAILPEAEIKATSSQALKEAYFAELDQSKQGRSEGTVDQPAPDDKPDDTKESEMTKAKPKPKLKKKAGADDPFASDDDDGPAPAKASTKTKKPALKGKAKRAESDEDADEPPKKKRARAK